MNKPEAKKTHQSFLGRFDSNLWHFHISVPKEIAVPFITASSRRVVCTLNKTVEFQCALMPDGNGDFFINLNKQVRDKLKIKEGDEVTYSLIKDESEYGLPMPQELAALFEFDDEGFQTFEALTPGKKRTLLYIAGSSKSPEIRIRKSICIVEHLKATKGKINYRQLNEQIKNAS